MRSSDDCRSRRSVVARQVRPTNHGRGVRSPPGGLGARGPRQAHPPALRRGFRFRNSIVRVVGFVASSPGSTTTATDQAGDAPWLQSQGTCEGLVQGLLNRPRQIEDTRHHVVVELCPGPQLAFELDAGVREPNDVAAIARHARVVAQVLDLQVEFDGTVDRPRAGPRPRWIGDDDEMRSA